jgi:hypothetical protein
VCSCCTSVLQQGQSGWMASHGRTQSEWYWCEHGSLVTRSCRSSRTSSRHTAQSSTTTTLGRASAESVGGGGQCRWVLVVDDGTWCSCSCCCCSWLLPRLRPSLLRISPVHLRRFSSNSGGEEVEMMFFIKPIVLQYLRSTCCKSCSSPFKWR